MLGFAAGTMNGVMCTDWPGKNETMPYAVIAILMLLALAIRLMAREAL